MRFEVPNRLARTVAGFQSGIGDMWLRDLPRIVAECCDRWSLELCPPFPYPSLSYVAPATRADGTAVVLKLGFLREELASETAALRLFDGRGAVRLLDADPSLGAMLLERLTPGTNLVGLDDEEAVAIAASVMRELWRPVPPEHQFPTVECWCQGLARLRERFGGGTGPIASAAVELAESLAADLLASAPAPMVLHGDLQHFNVLRAERHPWLAIDPKGVVGDPAFEPGAYMGNQWEHHPGPTKLMARRVDQFASELGLDRERVRAWGIVQSVLSAWWHVEDEGECDAGSLRHIELMAGVPSG